MKKGLLILFAVSTMVSCGKEPNFPYSEGINLYLNETFHLDIEDQENETFVFLYLEYCKSCITDALRMIDTASVVNDDLTLFFIGEESTYPENQNRIERLKKKFDFEIDQNSNHYSFSSGINEPLILKIRSGYIQEHCYINDSSFERSWGLIANGQAGS